jgi:hypothetical protein
MQNLASASKKVPQKELDQILLNFIIFWYKIINTILVPLGTH